MGFHSFFYFLEKNPSLQPKKKLLHLSLSIFPGCKCGRIKTYLNTGYIFWHLLDFKNWSQVLLSIGLKNLTKYHHGLTKTTVPQFAVAVLFDN